LSRRGFPFGFESAITATGPGTARRCAPEPASDRLRSLVDTPTNPGIFAGGDIGPGPDLVTAVHDDRRIAESIDRYLKIQDLKPLS
jgi:NADPH-dependent glutamate synthase beta subunit-like oxidoreductase